MEAGHHRPDRDVEDLRRVRVGEVADVDEHDDVAELGRDLGQRVHDGVLRQALDDDVLLERLLARRRGELVREVVVGLLERLRLRRALDAAATVDVQVREDAQEPGAHVRARE